MVSSRFEIGLIVQYFALAALVLVACNRDKSGCTDFDAVNYASQASEDDGTCAYAGEISFWYDGATRDSLLTNGVQTVMPYVDQGNFTNFATNDVVWTGIPICTANATRLYVDLKSLKSKWVVFTIAYDNVINVAIEDSVFVESNGCALYQIIWE